MLLDGKEEKTNMDTIESVYYLVVIGWYCGYIFFMGYLHVRHSIPYRNEYDKEYCESIPSPLSPGALSMLMYKKIKAEVLTATIFALIKKRILTVRAENNDYIIRLTNADYATLDLGNSQKQILEFLIDMMNDEKEVSLSTIHNYCNGNSGSSEFLFNYQIWKKIILKESYKTNFFEDKVDYSKVKLLKYIGLCLFAANFLLKTHLLIGYFILVPIYFLPLYFYKIYKRTVVANEEYYKWLAFKNYLANISDFNYDNKEIDKYLVYATILNVNEKFKVQNPTDFNADFVNRLNIAVNRCVIRANLYGNRSIKKLGN